LCRPISPSKGDSPGIRKAIVVGVLRVGEPRVCECGSCVVQDPEILSEARILEMPRELLSQADFRFGGPGVPSWLLPDTPIERFGFLGLSRVPSYEWTLGHAMADLAGNLSLRISSVPLWEIRARRVLEASLAWAKARNPIL
jgi:hypothetical protein